METISADGSGGARDDDEVAHFVERFAVTLTESGMPRMPARVFVRLLATDDGRLTAVELAEALQISAAAVSNAVQYLTGLGLVAREREPGARKDHYRVYDDVWYEALVRREKLLDRWQADLREGMEALSRGTPAGDRLAEVVEFFAFLNREMPHMLERRRQHRERRRPHG